MKRRNRKATCRGQTITESVLGLLMLCLIFMWLTQLGIMTFDKMILQHANYVSARSHVVGFDEPYVKTARRIGGIGAAGRLEQPERYAELNLVQRTSIEPILIERWLNNFNYELDYTEWDSLEGTIRGEGDEFISAETEKTDYRYKLFYRYQEDDDRFDSNEMYEQSIQLTGYKEEEMPGKITSNPPQAILTTGSLERFRMLDHSEYWLDD